MPALKKVEESSWSPYDPDKAPKNMVYKGVDVPTILETSLSLSPLQDIPRIPVRLTGPKKFSKDDMPLILEEKTFVDSIEGDRFLVLFYSQTCGHCTQFKPLFKEISKEIYESAYTAMVDCEKQTFLCEELDVQYYPALYLFYNGKYYLHSGGRSKDRLTELVNTDEVFLNKKAKNAFQYNQKTQKWELDSSIKPLWSYY